MRRVVLYFQQCRAAVSYALICRLHRCCHRDYALVRTIALDDQVACMNNDALARTVLVVLFRMKNVFALREIYDSIHILLCKEFYVVAVVCRLTEDSSQKGKKCLTVTVACRGVCTIIGNVVCLVAKRTYFWRSNLSVHIARI